jgi:hypothetical protein
VAVFRPWARSLDRLILRLGSLDQCRGSYLQLRLYYLVVRIKEQDRHRTAFNIRKRKWESCVLTFGLSNRRFFEIVPLPDAHRVVVRGAYASILGEYV